jgi:tRNA U34 5-methylaminomethyl-2-thiouridine-forming methyltransferase MnmC
MERKIILTKDGSHSVSIPELNVTYHSLHGAIQESMHVFIEAGLKPLFNSPATGQLRILEVGFGTGLNALLTAIAVENTEQSIYYVGLEPFPLKLEDVLALNYCELAGRQDLQQDFINMHQLESNRSMTLTENIILHKSNSKLQTFKHTIEFNLIYFDTFAPSAQPELWTKEIFEKLHSMMTPGGVLVTYCSKSDVRRAMQAAGFTIEKIPGPRGKREMVRARLPTNDY